DVHFLVARLFADLGRKRQVNAPLTLMRIDRTPDGFATLFGLRQHVPVDAWPRQSGDRGPVQRHVVLAGTPVPDQIGALAAVLEIFPSFCLIISRRPIMREDDHRACPRWLWSALCQGKTAGC